MDSLTIFKRRLDLPPQRRMLLAYVITHQKRQGQVTELSQKYHVSRTFLYENAKKYASVDKIGLSSVLSREAKIVACQKSILFYRLFSNCSLNSIQTFLEHDGSVNDSLGYISEFLRDAGQAVGQDLNLSGSGEQTYQVVFASDEIFAGERAILITVEPISLTILRIELAYERTSEGWQEQWQSLKNQHITPSLFVKDEGCALKCAQNILFANTAVQSDTFHAVSHRLGLWVKRLEKAAFTLMLELEEKERLFCTAQTPQTAQKRLDIYLNCYKETIKAMDLYHNFAFIYQNLIQSFKAFDNKGELKDKENVLDDFQAAIDLGKMLNHKPITKELKTIETLKFTLFTFFDTTKKSLKMLQKKLEKILSPLQLNAFCSAWQYNKAKIKAKCAKRRNNAKNMELSVLENLKNALNDDYQYIKNMIYNELDQSIQSSAAVENINSILRPFLNTIKNNVTQQALNLFMFFHNHRIFKNGKRKGKSPMQILTGKPHEEVIDLILRKMEA